MRIYIFQNDKTPNIIKKQEIHYAATVDYNILDNACATTTTSTRYHTQHQCPILDSTHAKLWESFFNLHDSTVSSMTTT